MKYSSWIWEISCNLNDMKGKKRKWQGHGKGKFHEEENEKIWKDVRENELKWKERQWQQTRLTPPKIRKLYLVLPYWFLITFGLLWGLPCPSQLVLALLLSCPFQVKSQKGKTSVVCRFGKRPTSDHERTWKEWKTWNKRNWMHM